MSALLLKSTVFQKVKDVFRLRIFHQGFSLSTQLGNEKIIIPNRIKRSPTDILQALASTVGDDTSGPHYKYMDDPYLTPASSMEKRSYSLAKESGRKAARWIRDQHSELFQHNPEDPMIEAFYPKVTYTKESDVSEDTLRELIQKTFVTDAIQVYQICKSRKIDISESIRQDLLELVSYYNCEDNVDEDWVEERWYRQVNVGRRKRWKDNGVAEQIFESLSTKGPAAYCALIRGMSNFFSIDRAWQLYQEAHEREITLDTDTYNSILRIVPYLREGKELRWQLIQDVLKTMAEKGIHPNIGTLNRTLESLVQLAGWYLTRDLSIQVLSEFRSIGIQPSLATYYYLLMIHCREMGPVSDILPSILDAIEGETFEIQDMKDTFFFVTAMDICCNHLKSLEVAHRVNKLLHTGDNYCLIGDSYKQSIYYRHYFAVACSVEVADVVMEMYNDIVPHIYTPERAIMGTIVELLKIHDAFGYLPQIWSDMIVFDHTGQDKLLDALLSCTAAYSPSAENSQLTKQISVIAWDVWTKVQNQDEKRRHKVIWSGAMVSNVLITLLHCESYDKASQVFQEALKNPENIIGVVSYDSLKLMSHAALDREDTNLAVNVVIYAAEAGHERAAELARETLSDLGLNSHQKDKVTSALGIDIFESK